MQLASKATRIASLLVALALVTVVFSFGAHSQEKTPEKPKTDQTPAARPTPTPAANQQKKMGTELDGPVVVNTDLVTLTVTVTDTYGRYVSGLSKSAFSVFDDKQQQEI